MTKFVNIAHEADNIPNLVNVDEIARIRPGLINSNWSGREDACSIYFKTTMDEEYENNLVLHEIYVVEVYLSTREMCRRLREEVFTV